jgi:hypothetical protein
MATTTLEAPVREVSFDGWIPGAKPSAFQKLLTVLTGICALFALSITTYAEATPSPSAQPESEGEPQSEELKGSAAVLASFSRDASHVYAIDLETSNLFDINLEKNAISTIDLGASIDRKPIMSVGTAKAGDLLVATPRAAWSCKPASKVCKKLCNAPEGIQFAAMAYDPKSGGILFSTRTDFDYPAQTNHDADPAMFLAAGAKEAKAVWSRRVGLLDGIAFASDGELFFGYRGDLWVGSIGSQEDNEETPWLLDAIRCAPLATFETTMATPTQVGVFSVAIAKQMIYVHLHRMFGTGEGNIIRLPMPGNASSEESDNEVRDRMRLYSKETGAVEVLTYNGTISYLCASPDGRRVFFTDGVLGPEHETKAYLVENNGKPREIKLKLPE